MIDIFLRYSEGNMLYSAIWRTVAPPMVGDYFDLVDFSSVIDRSIEEEEREWSDIDLDTKFRLQTLNFKVKARCWDAPCVITLLLEKCEPLNRDEWWGR